MDKKKLMDRLTTEDIKQELYYHKGDNRQNNIKESSRHGNTFSSPCIKQEVDLEEKFVINPEQQINNEGRYSVGRCTKVKKEEEGVECKVEWDGDECDCLECRVEREIKIEFNQTNATANQEAISSLGPSEGMKDPSLQCKRVKKEEDYDDDHEWDEDCDCGQCRRMREKDNRRGNINTTENQRPNDGDRGDDGEEKEVEENVGENEDGLNVDQEGSDEKLCENDDTEIDDEEYEMDIDGEESSNDDRSRRRNNYN